MPDSGPPPMGAADIQGYVFKDHPTHWFFFVRREHAPKPSDNGYAIYGYLKTKHTHADFVEKVKEFMRESDRPDSPPWSCHGLDDKQQDGN